MSRTALIVAGGKGLRMGSELPKQFLLIGNKPVLMHTLHAFHRFDSEMNLIVVLPREQQAYWKELCLTYNFTIEHQLADGGDTRFHSVKNGLQLIKSGGVVAVHDGVRPFVSQEVIARCFHEAALHLAAIPVVDVVETLRKQEPMGSTTVNRNNYKLVQTPQVFETALLQRAYTQPYSPLFTDDASVVESLGLPIKLVEGNRENIKITTPFDLKLGEVLLTCLI